MKNKFDKLREKNKENTMELKKSVNKFYEVKNRIEKLDYVSKNVSIIIDDLDKKFEEATKLKNIDISFLFLATALQITRQIFTENYFTDESRPTDKEAAGENKYDRDNRSTNLYTTSVEEIWSNPVPFDTQNGSSALNLNLGGGSGHRMRTAGHDPILGLIFGTANISTRTLTTMPEFASYHVEYGHFQTGKGHASLKMNDYLSTPASTIDVLNYGIWERLVNPSKENTLILVSSLAKELQHLASDWMSKESLCLPFMAINQDVAKKVGSYNIDMASFATVAKQAIYTESINQIVSLIHKLLITAIEPTTKNNLIEVRTRKIIAYSNIMASTTNLAYVGITNNINRIDIGGLMVTIYRLITSRSFQQEQKRKFLKEGLYDLIEDI